MQAPQQILEKENKLLDLCERQDNHLLVNRMILALMVLAPFYEIYVHYTYKNILLLSVYLLMIVVYLLGAYFFDQYLTKTVIGLVSGIIVLEAVAIIMAHESPNLLCIQIKFMVGFCLLKVYFNAKKIASVKKNLQFRQAEIELLREELNNNYKKTLQGLSVYVNPLHY
ncbi:hypothetical protein [Flammeovirga sp. SJP92]|uniref:hypothetical protein n=1 Tax=Flammeovirga sp. SJP92 TaxID=1775430 RepID=UPI0007871798|nr:hypothetical protein [Flammeovirga sp. SJP92]KXX69916.1 hypothetical protein AVL50_13630 [Flammeovirga sp. SJP92]